MGNLKKILEGLKVAPFEYLYHFMTTLGVATEAGILFVITLIYAVIPLPFLNSQYFKGHFWQRKGL